MSAQSTRSATDYRRIPSLLKFLATIGGARVFGAGLAVVTQIMLANWLGAAALGTYFQALSIAAILAIVFCLGLPSVAVRFITEYRTSGRLYELHQFIRSSRYFIAIATAIGGTVGAAIVFSLAPMPDQTALLIGVATALPLALMRLNGAIANACRQFQTAYLPDLLGRPITILAVVLIVPAIGLGGSVELILSVHLVAVVGLALWQYQRIEQSLPFAYAAKKRETDWSDSSKSWLAASMPLVPVALLTAAFADVIIVTMSLLMAKEELAIFAVCLKLALLAGFSIQLAHQLILPDAAEAYTTGRIDDLRTNIAQVNLISVSLCIALTVIFALSGNYVLGLFGQEFSEGHWCLVILSLSLLAKAALGPAAHMLVLAKRERSAVVAASVAVLTLLCASVIAVPSLGMIGACLAVLAVMLVWSGLQAWMVWRYTGIPTIGFYGLGRKSCRLLRTN